MRALTLPGTGTELTSRRQSCRTPPKSGNTNDRPTLADSTSCRQNQRRYQSQKRHRPQQCHQPTQRRGPAALKGLAVTAALIVVLFIGTGCGNSADPANWAEAEERDFTDPETDTEYGSAVEFNFMSTCLHANRTDSGGNLTPAEAQVLCRCVFAGLRDNLTFQEFKELDDALRDTPNPSDLDEEPEDIWDDHAEGILDSCARRMDI